MRTGWVVFYFMSIFATVSIVAADADPLVQSRIAPQDLKWEWVGTGNERSNIAGDDTKAGVYAYRIRFPANSRVAPHFHPDERVGTVLSGTFYFGYGTQFDETALKALPAGSSWTEPSKQPHFAWAKDGEVVIQVVGFGPSGTTRLEAK
jgi:quercetin dioxygenase-like cupin family protein